MEMYKNAYIAYAKEDSDNWYKRPLRRIINRITTLENDAAEAGKNDSFATATSVAAWSGTSLLKEKRGFQFLPLNVAQDQGKEGLRTALRLLPGEIATDLKNGGLSFGYTALYYTKNKELINGFEAKASYVAIHDSPDFIRADIDAFKEYDEFIKLGQE